MFLRLFLRIPAGFLPLLSTSLEAILPTEQRSLVEHVLEFFIQCPRAALGAWTARELHEAVIEGQVVTNGSLPFVTAFVVWELLLDEGDDLSECGALFRGFSDGHTDEGDVGVGRLPGFQGPLPNTTACPRNVDFPGRILETTNKNRLA